MRFTEDTRFPHPVLGLNTGDYTSGGTFDVDFRPLEDPRTGELTLLHSIELDEESIRGLVEEKEAAVGYFVRCGDTYYNQLHTMEWPSGRTNFSAGTLLNRVILQPIVWLRKGLDDWDPGTVHQEFSPPVSLPLGAILAVGDEFVISVGQAKLAPIDSIFELDQSPDLPEGELRIVADGDRITILAAEDAYETIQLLRNKAIGPSVVMNSVYLPAVMEVLQMLQGNEGEYTTYPWHTPFMAKCDAMGIDPERDSIFESAQKLLSGPVRRLRVLTIGDG